MNDQETNWLNFARLALNHMRAHAYPPYVVTVKEWDLKLIGRPIVAYADNDNAIPSAF